MEIRLYESQRSLMINEKDLKHNLLMRRLRFGSTYGMPGDCNSGGRVDIPASTIAQLDHTTRQNSYFSDNESEKSSILGSGELTLQ